MIDKTSRCCFSDIVQDESGVDSCLFLQRASNKLEQGRSAYRVPRNRPARTHIMFYCAISGEPPQDPVISSKSGHVYERRLVQKYITENGTDPVTGEKLEESDLVSVKASMSVSTPCCIKKLMFPFQVLLRLLDLQPTHPYRLF